ncbi:MAG TPA: NAD(P)/FAD-dependent oxidoreductase [Rhizomicrobium sp.]
MEKVDCLVIGAGAVGLAIARALALAGREVIVLERENAIGTGVSSRNSEVIHAGMYYPRGSLKAGLCVRGNRLLRDYAQSHGVPFRMTGKLIVATGTDDEARLRAILDAGHANGVAGLHQISASAVRAMEPELFCTAALLSPDTGIVDSHALMLSYQGEAEAHGANIVFRAPLEAGRQVDDGAEIQVGGDDPIALHARTLVIAAGLSSCRVATMLGIPDVPTPYFCKGNYFSLTGKSPFGRLVYPLPTKDGLGTHYTLDLAGRGRFGPDVEWITQENYTVDPRRGDSFYAAIRNYWPGLKDGALEPSYCGIRPKISAPGDTPGDFLIRGPREHGAAGVVALYGIESPGLTASLAIAERVAAMLMAGG